MILAGLDQTGWVAQDSHLQTMVASLFLALWIRLGFEIDECMRLRISVVSAIVSDCFLFPARAWGNHKVGADDPPRFPAPQGNLLT